MANTNNIGTALAKLIFGLIIDASCLAEVAQATELCASSVRDGLLDQARADILADAAAKRSLVLS